MVVCRTRFRTFAAIRGFKPTSALATKRKGKYREPDCAEQTGN